MTGRLLFVASEPPSLGGSSTAAFALFRKARAEGADVHYLTLLDPEEAPSFTSLVGDASPEPCEQRISVCSLTGPFLGVDPALTAVINRLDPAIVIGFGYRAAGTAKAAAPGRRVVFVTGSCKEAQYLVTSGHVADAMALEQSPGADGPPTRVHDAGEARAVESCDLIVTHSPQTLAFMERFYPSAIGKIYPRVVSFAEWICDDAAAGLASARPFEKRDIDVLFIASLWDRVEKNYPLVRAIAARLPELTVHVIGDCERPDPRTVHEGFLSSRGDTFDRIGRARVLVCPSLIDAAPGVLFEGSVLGCNLVASRNCGNWTICHPDLLADSLDTDVFAACIRRGVQRPYADSRGTFLEAGGYAELFELLTALAHPFADEVVP